MIYKPKEDIDGRFKVVFPIKRGAKAETYRVKDTDGTRYFLKLIDTSLLDDEAVDAEGKPKEISILQEINSPHVPRFICDGQVMAQGRKFHYFVTEFLSSETLADRLSRTQTLSVYDARTAVISVLEALKDLHEMPEPVIHNEVTALNTLVDLSTDDLSKCKLIDFGASRKESDASRLDIEGLNWFYLAPECFDGVPTAQSDIYAVGALLYQLVFGILPWFCDLSTIEPSKRMSYLLRQKQTRLLMPQIEKFELDERLLNIMRKALAADVDMRFQSADEMLRAIRGTAPIDISDQPEATAGDRQDAFSAGRKGNGFADVAGMSKLKQMLNDSVLNILRNREKAQKYRLQIPNGILFYGPPGCGKTYLAEKFAEEAGYNFKIVKASDLASIYIHGSQQMIGKLFDEARQNAPSILCFDEFDALVPSRGDRAKELQSGEVNEFLSQLNNCGQSGVFVIASTNRPDMIDPAILRRGRIDKVVYVPLPDAESRAAMFELHLKGRPYDSNIDYKRLAEMTDRYIASDIAYIVNEAAAKAAFSDAKISQQMLEDAITANPSSLSPAVIAQHEKMREKMEGLVEQRRRVGF